jgi:hypothetical protein
MTSGQAGGASDEGRRGTHLTRHPLRHPAAVLAGILAVVLCACAEHAEPKVEENVVPTDYKAEILKQMRFHVDDPEGIRDAFIAEPALRPYGTVSRYIVCVRFNARNNEGRYLGSKDMAAFYYAGRITRIVDADRELCANSAYQPFPELQKLCRELVCKS